MARVLSLSILQGADGHAYLAEKYGPVIENIQSGTISSKFKNQELSGVQGAGSVEAKRFVNSAVQDYGTARAAHAGKNVKVATVTVPLNQHKEIIEEVEDSDVALLGVDNFFNRRTANQGLSWVKYFERLFWYKAANDGTEKNYTYTTKKRDAVMAAVLELEGLHNDFVRGVPRDLMGLVVTPSLYEAIHDEIDVLPNPNVNSTAATFDSFHGVEIDKSIDLPEGVDYVLMVKGSVAQPIRMTISDLEKIQMSNAYSFGMFSDFGTEVVASDLIFAGTITEADPT